MPKSTADDFLKANKTSKPSKSKVPTELADELHDKVYNAHVAFKDAESAFRDIEEQLLTKTNELYAAGALAGDFSKSMNLPGIQTPGVQVSYKDQFTAIPIEREGDLQALLGNKYALYFETKRDVKLQDGSAAAIDLLRDKLGDDLFLQLFATTLTIVPKADMDRRQFELDADTRKLLKQYKASVKLSK